jgi:hypothetical protein
MNDLLFFVAAALVAFGLLFAGASIAAERSLHHGAKRLRRTD